MLLLYKNSTDVMLTKRFLSNSVAKNLHRSVVDFIFISFPYGMAPFLPQLSGDPTFASVSHPRPRQFSLVWAIYQVGEMKINSTAPLNKLYDVTNTALFTSFTLSMHMLAISHWPSHIIDVAGECEHDAWVIN